MAFILLSIIYTIFVVPFNERSEAVLNVVAISNGKINEIYVCIDSYTQPRQSRHYALSYSRVSNSLFQAGFSPEQLNSHR